MSELDLPIRWVKCELKDIATVIGGGTPDTKDASNFDDEIGIPWITPADLNRHKGLYIGRGKRFLSHKGLKSSSAVLLPIGAVLFSTRAPIGYVAVASQPLATNQGFRSFVCGAGIYPEYIAYYLKTVKPLAEQMASGTTFLELSGSKAATIPIPLAPLEEQRRIVAKLDEVMDRIEAARARLERVPRVLKRFRESVLTAACSGRLTLDWREKTQDVESWGIGIELSEEIDGLKKWGRVPFGSVLSELRNGVPTKPSLSPPGVPILRISAARGGRIDLQDSRFLPKAEKLLSTYALRDGDLLFTRYNGTLELLGVCGMVRGLGSKHLIYPDKLMRARFAHPQVLPAYVEIYFQTPEVRDKVTEKSKSSAGQNGVSGSDLKTIHVDFPPMEEQHEIVRRVSALLTLADQLEARYLKAKAHFDRLPASILAKAFRGELVPQNPDDESADILLERLHEQKETQPGKKTRQPRSSAQKTLF